MHVHGFGATAASRSRHRKSNDGQPPIHRGVQARDPRPATKMTKNNNPAASLQTAGSSPYIRRGNECAFANVKLLSRVLTTLYDDALRPSGLRASQLALLWAIAAMEPVELSRLGMVTLTDQTTLSRTIANLKRERLVSVRPAVDRRVKMVSLTPSGRRRFEEAMPFWETAQTRVAALLPLDQVRRLARDVRRSARAA
jgi:DNA-binding MarR family transcriptional regulator